MTIFYFTATGNSLAVAKRFGGTLISIPQVIDSNELRYKDDIVGVVFPIYGLGLPKMVRVFLEKVKIIADYTFIIGTYGNMSGAAMRNVQKLARKNGYRFDYANDLLMLDNYLPMFEMSKEQDKLPSKNVEDNLTKIIGDIGKRNHLEASASVMSRALSAVCSFMPSNNKNALKYIVNEQCNNCGVCTQVCPAKNIKVTTDRVDFNERCEGCMACLHICPQNALHLKGEKSHMRWRHPEVSLKEIIKANNRG